MSSAKELREARRRKILERGGDRLAYITGQVKTLPSVEPVASPPPGESGLKSLSIAGELQSSTKDPEPTITPAHDVAEPTTSPTYDIDEISKKLTSVRDELQSIGSTPEETTPLLPPSLPAPLLTAPKLSTKKTRSSFNYAALVISIEQSLVVRAILSFLIGLALVMQWTYSRSYGSQKYILSWPILLVVVTDVTVVLGALLLGLVKVSPTPKAATIPDRGGLVELRDARVDQMLAFTSQLEGALDLGLLVTKASSGLISDISLYLVTVICAVSIAQHFQ